MNIPSLLRYLLALGCLASLVHGCGGGSSSAGKAAEIKSLSADDSSVVVGDDIDLLVDFSYSTDTVVHDNHNVTLIVRVPSGLQYQDRTARIDEIGGTDNVAPTIELCPNGDTILTFDLGQRVLANALDPGGAADGRLIMALLGTAAGVVSVDAVAGYDFEAVTGSCADGLVPQDTMPIAVL